MQRFTINRDFLETVRQAGGTGKYQEYANAALRGFGIKITPQGGIAYYYRWTRPNGKHSRKVVGHYPALAPSAARDLAKKMAATVDHSGDDGVVLVAKQTAREANAERVKVVPTVGEYLADTYDRHFHAKSPNKAVATRTIKDIRKYFPDLMNRPLDKVRRVDLID